MRVTSELSLGNDTRLQPPPDNLCVSLGHEGVRHLLLQTLLVLLVRIHFDAQISFNSAHPPHTLKPAIIKCLQQLPNLTAVHLESEVLCLLTGVRLLLDVVEDGDLLLEVALDVGALGLGHVLDGVLLTFKLFDLFASEGDLLLQLDYLFFQLVNGGLETEWLLRSQGLIRLSSNDGRTCTC